jgi:hypothetical protein
MTYTPVSMVGGIALMLAFAVGPAVAQHQERIQALRGFIELNKPSPAADEAQQFIRALVALDDKVVQEKLADDPENLELWQQLVAAYPHTPTAKQLQDQLDESKKQRIEKAAKDAFASLNTAQAPEKLLEELGEFLQAHKDTRAADDAQELMSDAKKQIADDKWKTLQKAIQLDADEILEAKKRADEEQAESEYDYGTKLVYDSDREQHLTKLIDKYPLTAAARKAEEFLKRQRLEQRKRAEQIRRVREFWDARYPSRTRLTE